MNTMQAEYKTDIARLAEDMAKRDVEAARRDAELKTDAARRDAEAAKRENRMLLAMTGIIAVAVAIIELT